MVRQKLNTPAGKKFLLALLTVFLIAVMGVGRVTIIGVVEQYNIPDVVDHQHVRSAIGNGVSLQHGLYRSAGHPAGDLFPRW